ncbi:hypothetical protein CRG98_036929 [Punica granatum]|uniref:Amine oxidase n=1 Tax=Punica granatum TaxID=22663 RepID=A0A2I0IF90_PUNGR|nr:hypothetical protein CRG98_036929 [Punica granatum]
MENGYARPVEGLHILVDMQNMVVLEFEDRRLVPLPPVDPLRNYTRGVTRGGVDRIDVKPLHVIQPEGPSFRVDGHFVEWQKAAPCCSSESPALAVSDWTQHPEEPAHNALPLHPIEVLPGSHPTTPAPKGLPIMVKSHTSHPLDPLSAAEISVAVATVRAAGATPEVVYHCSLHFSYKGKLTGNVTLLVFLFSVWFSGDEAFFLRRGAFVKHNLWVTRYAPDEMYPGGEFPNQNPRVGEGLATWVQQNRSLEEADVVLCSVSFAYPKAARMDVSLIMQPHGFFNCSPAVDVPPNASVLDHKEDGMSTKAISNGLIAKL